MITTYRVHQEHLARLRDSLRRIYSRPQGGKPGIPQKPSPLSAEGTGPAPGPAIDAGGLPFHDAWSETTSMADTADLFRSMEGLKIPVLRCRRCGESFPPSDFLYTQKTGLCILCWEGEVI